MKYHNFTATFFMSPDSIYHIYLQSFIDYIKFEKRFSQHTVIAYEKDLEQFFTYLEQERDSPPIIEIQSTYIKSWLANMMKDKRSAKTVNRKISTLKAFFKQQLKTGGLESTPMGTIVSPKISKRLPSYVEQKETDTLFKHVEFSEGFEGQTQRLILALLYATGMRLSELVNLKESQVDLGQKTLKVLGKGNKERIIPIGNDISQALADYLQLKSSLPEADHIFLLINAKGKKLYPKYVYLVVKKYLSLVTTQKKKSPHVLRHTFATHLTNEGADINAVKELLGHSSLAATQVYTHNTIERLKDVYRKAHPKA
ncbi:MAG: tyrosine-type recombinase/integrase [Agriterribacter sp.]